MIPVARVARPLRFVSSGALATGVHWLAMAALIGAGLAPAVATAGGVVAGAATNYPLQQRWTFGARPGLAALPGYLLTCGLGVLLNSTAFLLLHRGLALSVAPAQLVTTALVAVANYTLYKRCVFHERSHPPG